MTAAFSNLTDLAAAALGGRAVLASDDFFAGKDNLLNEGRGVFLPDEYTDRGKWMDGWESRRKRVPGHDWCIIKLGVPGVVRAVDIDTNHFLGNHPPFASIDACKVDGDPNGEWLRDNVDWTEILAEVPLRAGSQNFFAVKAGEYTHVRLNIHPDGGVARLRVFGVPARRAAREKIAEQSNATIDLAAVQNGARAVGCSDMFFSPMVNLILPKPASNMGGGWESRRRRDSGHDWIVIQLAEAGVLARVEIDTAFFKGNFPDRASLDGLYWPRAPLSQLLQSERWIPVLDEQKLTADSVHAFDVQSDVLTHVRLNIFPCGGVSRLRLHGSPAPPPDDSLVAGLNSMDEPNALTALLVCCGSKRWARQMIARRPFKSRAELHGAADHIWWRLGDADWLEAFAAHPQIGSNIGDLRGKFASLSSSEQAGAAGAGEATLEALAKGNGDYLKRYGYIFIVCATGKTAEQMRRLLDDRLDNPPENELRIAAGEQAKITHLRLEKLEAS